MSELFTEILVDPESHAKLTRASDAQLDALRAALTDGGARRRDGGELPASVEGAWLTPDGKHAFVDVDGFPSLLAEERIELDPPID